MSACEWCWAEASRRAMFLGGSTVDYYHEVLAEQERFPHEQRHGGIADARDEGGEA